jgi:putative ABC transport system substrate-binding protein
MIRGMPINWIFGVFVSGVLLLASAPSNGATATDRVWRLGWLGFNAPPSSPDGAAALEAFREGMSSLGHMEKRDFVTEARFADTDINQLPGLAKELVDAGVDMIVTMGTPATAAAKQATSTIPIIMVGSADPVGRGFVAGLAHPGGNVTGLTTQAPDSDAKRLQLLKEALPHLARIGLLLNPNAGSAQETVSTVEAAATHLGVQLQPFNIHSPEVLPIAFTVAAQQHLDAFIVITDGLTFNQRGRIAELAIAAHLPIMCESHNFADAGALMTYGPSSADLARRAAGYVDRILKGAVPSELPVEQPRKFEFIVNLKSARALGLNIPQSIIAIADRVVE